MDHLDKWQKAIDSIWPELPELIGDDWESFQQDLQPLIDQLSSAEDDLAERVLREIIVAFTKYEHGLRRLLQAMSETASAESDRESWFMTQGEGDQNPTSGIKTIYAVDEGESKPEIHHLVFTPGDEDIQGHQSAGWDLIVGMEAAHQFFWKASGAQPPTVTRFTDISCPRRVWIETPRITVVVRLTVERKTASVDVQAVTVSEGVPVQVRITAPNFRLLSPAQRTLPVPHNQGSETSFDLRPLAVGPARVTFDFVQSGNPVGCATAEVEVTQYQVSEESPRGLSQLIRFDGGLVPPDLTLYVAYEQVNGTPSLIYTLYQAGSDEGREFPPVPIRGEPRAYVARLYATLSRMAGVRTPGRNLRSAGPPPATAAELQEELTNIGQNLWRELLPADLRKLYAANRNAWREKKLLLLSDEPFIPWELVWPYSRSERWTDPEPWCASLRLTRWLRQDVTGGYDGPPADLQLSDLAYLAPTDTGLPATIQERTYLEQLIARFGLHNHSPELAGLRETRTLLKKGGYSWLHAATHGEFDVDDPEEDAAIWLQDRQALTPEMIIGAQIEGHIYATRPGFVFNTCDSGRQGWALTRLGGWANRLIGSGAGLFLAPMWTVDDAHAYAFATAFYDALATSSTVADALHAGRRAAFSQGDPTWLAYSLYAHPQAKVAVTPSLDQTPAQQG